MNLLRLPWHIREYRNHKGWRVLQILDCDDNEIARPAGETLEEARNIAHAIVTAVNGTRENKC